MPGGANTRRPIHQLRQLVTGGTWTYAGRAEHKYDYFEFCYREPKSPIGRIRRAVVLPPMPTGERLAYWVDMDDNVQDLIGRLKPGRVSRKFETLSAPETARERDFLSSVRT